ncbi:hypothetical protein J2S43_000020 [Catenuloplanes nepalensis]|uniref:Peptidase S1 domain-containing protein n=1 Tax=Catenuloplanes nepalensis TaxID=587533 RepID=A0ABT9MJN6_9ACTN|nr:hypothetical protein [Catenuloplanes nepalensis]
MLVQAEYVLTLKSCFDPAPVTNGAPPVATSVTVGRDDLSRSTGGVTAVVTELLPHPTLDAVLAKLATPVTGITPVAFGTAPVAGETLRAVGYGRTGTEWAPNRLQTVPMTVGGVTAGGFTLLGSGVSLCQGDGGGATIRETAGGPQLIGLHAGAQQQGCLESSSTADGAAEVRADVLANWLRPYTAGLAEPVAERSPNLASGATVTVSSFVDQWGWKTANVVDGVRTGTAWTSWPPNSPLAEEWIELAWSGGSQRAVNRVDLYPRSDIVAGVPTDIGVDVWENNAWKNVYRQTVIQAGGKPARISFPAHTTNRIRVTGYAVETMQLAEIEAYEARNLAADATINTSSHIDQWGWVEANVNDGVRTGIAWTSWPPNSPVDDEWIEMAFPGGAQRQVSRVDLYPRSDIVAGVAARISVDVWENDAWKRVRTWAEPVAGGKPVKILFAGQTTSRLRVTGHGVETMQLAEIEAYHSGNLAADATFTPSANLEEWGWSLSRISDGERSGSGFSTWPPNAPFADESVEIAFPGGAQRQVNRVEAWPRSDIIAALPADLGVEVWDGSAWQSVLRRTATLAAGQPALLTFPARTTSKIRLTGYGIEILQLAELEAHLIHPLAAVPAAMDPQPSVVEMGAYPGAAAILEQFSIRLLRGDGHIVWADCATPPVDNVGVIKVRTTEPIGPGGNGLACFKVTAPTGWLALEVPAVYEIRGDGQRTGTGHPLTAEVTTDDGDHTTVQVNPSGSTQVGIGISPDNEPTTLLRLTVTG